ncbi:MAG TPA: hypothetical protein P5081_00970 [Phycisphaerae bacterium]|nr:hypothetical protein [Phycisphaerae bacterium]HRW51424.1 hypothetical protein [Phycisphaerae bacterium]
METALEFLPSAAAPYTFRIAFHAAVARCLLPYPSVTGLIFLRDGEPVAEWVTRSLVTEPLDDFVLRQGDRIAFDLRANINSTLPDQRWGIELPSATYDVHFSCCVDRDTEWHNLLAKRSRFAAATTVWCGVVVSNTLRVTVDAATVR